MDLMTLALIGMALFFVIPYILIFMKWYNNKRALTERSIDAHGMLYKKMKKAAKLNMRGGICSRVVCLGDADQYPIKTGKLVGPIQSDTMSHFFIRTKALRPARWSFIPPGMHGSLLYKTLVLHCNGLEPVGNFYEPIFSRNMDPRMVADYRALIDRYEEFLIYREENVELTEQKVSSWNTALNAGRFPEDVIERVDSLQLIPGGDQGEKKYAEEQT